MGEMTRQTPAARTLLTRDSAIATTCFDRRVRAPASLGPTALGGDYTLTWQGAAHATGKLALARDEPAPHLDLVRYMLLAWMGDHDLFAAICDVHIAWLQAHGQRLMVRLF